LQLNVKIKYENLNIGTIKDGLDQVFGMTSHIGLNMDVENTEIIETPLPGNYFIDVQCKAKKNEAFLHTNRIAKLSLKDCSGSRVEEGIVSLLSAVFAPEFKMLKEKYLPMKDQNVSFL
jgi:hypothetical protein